MSKNLNTTLEIEEQGGLPASLLESLSDAAFTNLNCIAFKVSVNNGTVVRRVTANYIGAGAITLSDYANLPKYSVLVDYQAYKVYYKIAAAGTSTWKTLTMA